MDPQQLEALRSTLRSAPQYNDLRSKVSSLLSTNPNSEDILATLLCASSTPAPVTPLDPDAVYLRVKIGRGSAFVNHLSSTSRLADLSLSLSFKGSRVTTVPVRSNTNPAFDGTFSFPLTSQSPVDSNGWYDLITDDCSKLHIVCTSSPTPSSDTHKSFTAINKDLVAAGSVDWRSSLVNPDGGNIELAGCGGAGGFLVGGGGGSVHMTLSLVQSTKDLTLPLTTDDILRHITLQEQKEIEHARDFYMYAKDWWRGFQEISPIHSNRSGVRIFAEDEIGTNRCVCTYVSPVKVGRLIDSPRHAARFVSLIPFERRSGVGGRRVDSWQSWHSFLSKGRGDVEDHACLLCSLLKGFGLDAYVCMGQAFDSGSDAADETREHAWVVVVGGADGDVTFIESLTGQRYEVLNGKSVDKDLPYASVSCAFNDVGFYANKNADDSVVDAVWDFNNVRCWKAMDKEAVKVAPRPLSNCATLVKSTIGVEVAEGLEREIMGMIKERREERFGLSAIFDDELGYLLQPAVAAYENERLTGYSFGSADFQNAVKNAVPDRHCFKGLPLCFAHMDAAKILAGIEGSDVGADIFKTRGDQVNFALRVKCYVYPENTLAVWVMLAVRFLPKEN